MGNCVPDAGQPGLAVVGIAVGEIADKGFPVADDALLGLEAFPELTDLAVASLQEQLEGGDHLPRHRPEPDSSALRRRPIVLGDSPFLLKSGVYAFGASVGTLLARQHVVAFFLHTHRRTNATRGAVYECQLLLLDAGPTSFLTHPSIYPHTHRTHARDAHMHAHTHARNMGINGRGGWNCGNGENG